MRMFRFRISSILIATLVASCAADGDDGQPGEGDELEQPDAPTITIATRVSDLPAPGSIGTPIDGYTAYDSSIDSISACGNGSKRPGPQAFSDYLASLGMAGNNYAACQTGFHPRGMALDIYAGGFTGLQQFANWITANNSEMARRLGVVQVIFNSRMWRSYYGGAGKPQGAWGSYSGSDPHTSHVHVSFGEAGATASTSFYRDVLHIGGGGSSGTHSTFTQCGYLLVNQAIGTDRALPSCDGRFFLAMQGDGNLVLYRANGTPKWASNTYGSAGRLAIMQGDGNFVVYTTGWAPVWYTSTAGRNGAILAMQNDGNVVIYLNGVPIWNTGTWE